MNLLRVITDIPADRVGFVLAMISADSGRVVEQKAEGDGEFTVVAEFAGVAAPPPLQPAAGAPQEKWLAVAKAELGQSEQAGAASNPRIEAYHATTSGGAADDSVPWCSSFVNFCVEAAGVRGTRSKAARSWLRWGVDAGDFVPGCVVVLKRGEPPQGHVGFYVGTEGGRIRVLGGNQGDRVSIASFDARQVLGRRLAA